MDSVTDRYRGYSLVARKSDRGWQVSIEETGRNSTFFSNDSPRTWSSATRAWTTSSFSSA